MARVGVSGADGALTPASRGNVMSSNNLSNKSRRADPRGQIAGEYIGTISLFNTESFIGKGTAPSARTLTLHPCTTYSADPYHREGSAQGQRYQRATPQPAITWTQSLQRH
jgi:hypothetical protein